MTIANAQDDSARFAFAKGEGAKQSLLLFFSNCINAVGDGLIKDAVDVGMLCQLLGELTVNHSKHPEDAKEGFKEGCIGEYVPDEDFVSSLYDKCDRGGGERFAFADKFAAETRLQRFFDRCSEAVAEGVIIDAVSVGILARHLEQLTIELGAQPAACHRGFLDGQNGDRPNVSDSRKDVANSIEDGSGESMDALEAWCATVKAEIDKDGAKALSEPLLGTSEPWGSVIAKELAKLNALAEAHNRKEVEPEWQVGSAFVSLDGLVNAMNADERAELFELMKEILQHRKKAEAGAQ